MWSLKHDKCLSCGTVEVKHVARGLCRTCYQKESEKRQKRTRKELTKEYLFEEHVVKRKSLKDIARDSGFSYDDVYHAFLSYDLHKCTDGDPTAAKRPPLDRMEKAGHLLTKEYIIDEYVLKGRSPADIAKDCGCSRQFVYRRVLSFGINPRDKRSARNLAYEQGKITFERTDEEGNSWTVTLQKNTYNESFFTSWSPEMAYVLGVIYTDGNLTPKDAHRTLDRLTISQKEPELLTKVLALMGCNARLLYNKERKYGNTTQGAVYYFHVNNDKIYSDLIALGLMPKKSRVITFPQIPPEYVRHFLRGCWDGDGSFYGNISASFVSGSRRFVEGMLSELETAGFPKRTVYATRAERPAYYFRFHKADCIKLYHYFYDDVPETQYLRKKYDIIKPVVEAFELRKKARQGSLEAFRSFKKL